MIDLLLGGDIGLWTLENWPLSSVATVLTLDNEIVGRAQELGLTVVSQNANDAEYEPAHTGFSIHYPRIIKEPLLERYKKLYNLHPGFLPWGRGYYPVFWAMWENTPAGATLHEISLGIDEGPIIHQVEVPYTEEDTGYSLYLKVRSAEQDIIRLYTERIINGEDLTTQRQVGEGTYHSKQDFLDLKNNAHWAEMSSEQLVKLIRCLSFPKYTGLQITLGNKQFSVSLVEIAHEN